MSFDFIAAIKNVAPMLAGTFGTPLMGMAISALCNVLPTDAATTVRAANATDPVRGAIEKLGDLLQQGTLDIAQVKQAELAHKERMTEMGYKTLTDLMKLESDDRANARQRQIAVKDNIPTILAFAITLGFFITLGLVVVNGIPVDGGEAVLMLLGALTTAWIAVVTYYFGSSSGSKTAQATLAEIAKTP